MKFKRKTILTLAWALLLAPVFVLLLAGCSATKDQFPERKRDAIFAEIFVVDEIPNAKSDVLGQAKWSGNRCTVYVRSDIYPYAMTHELMHCFSGNWHEGVRSAEYQHIVD
jgi:hypothetical protein